MIDDYLAVRVIGGDWPDGLPDDELALPATRHWRLLQRVHTPGTTIIPDWVGPWRAGLEQQREKVVDYLDDRARRRAETAVELADLPPTLGAAQRLGSPTAARSARSKRRCGAT